MFRWLWRRRIAQKAKDVRRFVLLNFTVPEPIRPDPEVRYSDRNPTSDPEIKYSDRGSASDPETKYSDRGRGYDPSSVDRAMSCLSVSFPRGTNRLLDPHTDRTFSEELVDLINRKQLKDPDVYKAAQIDRRLFSRIVSNRTYRPSGDTCVALALALHLSLKEANDLLSRAGYVLSHSMTRDLAIEYCFRAQIYDLIEVNEILYQLGEKPLGR